VRHAERCDHTTYCGRRIRPNDSCEARDVPWSDVITFRAGDMCRRCYRGLTPESEKDSARAEYEKLRGG
jgi:hypothetical protein